VAGITADPANSSIMYLCSDMPKNDGIHALQTTYSWFLRMCSAAKWQKYGPLYIMRTVTCICTIPIILTCVTQLVDCGLMFRWPTACWVITVIN